MHDACQQGIVVTLSLDASAVRAVGLVIRAVSKIFELFCVMKTKILLPLDSRL